MTVYTDVKAEAGSGRVVYPDEAEHTIELPRHFISRILGFSPPREVGVMTADGDSMRPTIQDGDLILYRPAEEVRGGGVYVLLIDDRQIVKRVQTISGGGYRIISDNSYHGYADETLVPADDHTDALVNEETGRSVDLRVVGSVIFPRRDTDHLHVQQVAEIIRGMTNGDPMQQLRAQKS
jgi:phage repressor protein C with HTH and peptisase S24 domain